MRGEYEYLRYDFFPDSELPPRARRIRAGAAVGDFLIGTTSACAENTAYFLATLPFGGNYLRVRGEYYGICELGGIIAELPPRARRIRSSMPA